MIHASLRWILGLAALLVVGPIAGWFTGRLSGPDGSDAASLLVSSSLISGVSAGLAVLVLAGFMGAFSARLLDMRAGMFNAGLVLCWAAWRLGSSDGYLLSDDASARLPLMSFEAVLFGAAGLIAAGFVLASGTREPDEPGFDETVGPMPKGTAANALAIAGGTHTLAAAAVGALVALAVAALITRTGAPGQLLAGAIIGCVAAGAFGRLAGAATGGDAPMGTFVASAVLAAALGPVLELVFSGGNMDAAIADGGALGVGRITLLHWLAGAMLGVPWGVRWFHASVHKKLAAA